MQQHSENEWIEHDGGECPVDVNTQVIVRLVNGEEFKTPDPASYWIPDGKDDDQFNYWTGRGGPEEANRHAHHRIIAYRVVPA